MLNGEIEANIDLSVMSHGQKNLLQGHRIVAIGMYTSPAIQILNSTKLDNIFIC
jgi:hypothetical protein